jgi:hypothetical protein
MMKPKKLVYVVTLEIGNIIRRPVGAMAANDCNQDRRVSGEISSLS